VSQEPRMFWFNLLVLIFSVFIPVILIKGIQHRITDGDFEHEKFFETAMTDLGKIPYTLSQYFESN
jgi:hypothetical protein